MAEAALGTSVKVPTVDGEDLDIEVPPGTQPGTVFKLSRLGMPRLRRRGRGDLLVEMQVLVPTSLNAGPGGGAAGLRRRLRGRGGSGGAAPAAQGPLSPPSGPIPGEEWSPPPLRSG